MGRGKDLLFLPYTFISSFSTVGFLLHLQHYQRCEPMILKMLVKSKFVLCQPRYLNLLTKKIYKKIHVFGVVTFLKTYCYWQISRHYLEIPSIILDDIFLGDSTLSNSIALVEGLRRWYRSFEIFLIDRYDGKIGNKNIAVKY